MRGRAKDGKGSIIINVYHNFSTSSFSTGIRVSPSEWAGDKVVKVSGCEAINARLHEMKTKIDKQIAILSINDNFEQMSASDIKAEISEDKVKKTKGHYISDLFKEYISVNNLKPGTKELYNITLKKILDFSGDIIIEKINLKWLLEFDRYLAKTICVNSRSIYLRNLRAVCNYACHIEINYKYPFINFQIKQEPTRKRSATIELLRKLYRYPTSKQNAMYRDYFFLMFFLIGINAKDLLLAKKSQVIDGRLEYIREKTNKKYSVKIEPEAAKLIKKYSGKGEYLLDAMDHCVHYKSFFRQINEALRRIGPKKIEYIQNENNIFEEPKQTTIIQPVIPGITTYYARHSWATIAYSIGVPLNIISQALGHADGNRTTLIYVKYDQLKADEANRKVIDYLMQYE